MPRPRDYVRLDPDEADSELHPPSPSCPSPARFSPAPPTAYRPGPYYGPFATFTSSETSFVPGHPPPVGAAASRPSRWLTERVGVIGFVSIVAGIPLQLGILAFLGYLWSRQADVDSPSTVWRKILFGGWMVSVVTLASVVIRYVLGTQLIACTALAASLILDTDSVHLRHAANFSLLRTYNSGPLDAVWLFLRAPGHFLRSTAALLVVVLYLLGTALQFSSTLLTSDLGAVSVRSDRDARVVSYADGTGSFVKALSTAIWATSLTSFPLYAEADLPGTDSIADDAIADTGTVQRAFLPFDAADRLRLLSFEGKTVVQQGRTVCVPAIVDVHPGTVLGNGDMLSVVGNVSWSLQPFFGAGILGDLVTRIGSVDLDGEPGPITVAFECPWLDMRAGVRGIPGDKLHLVMCSLGTIVTPPDSDSDGPDYHSIWNDYGQFLVINSPGDVPRSFVEGDGARDARVVESSGWAHYLRDGGEPSEVVLSASVCGLRMRHIEAAVAASTDVAVGEPALTWDNRTQRWDADGILSMLGVATTAKAGAGRGVMAFPAVEDPDWARWRADDRNVMIHNLDRAFWEFPLMVPNPMGLSDHDANRALIFCTACRPLSSPSYTYANPSYVLLVQAALNATDNNLAHSLDALWTAYSQVMYYSGLNAFDRADTKNSTMVWSVRVQGPVRWAGLVAVAALTLSSAAAMITVFVMFGVRARHSLCGEAWCAVAQVVAGGGKGSTISSLLEDATGRTDGEMADLIKERGMLDVCVATGVDGRSGKVGLMMANTKRG